MGVYSKTELELIERNKKIQELKSNPDRKAIRKFVFIREDINTDKVFAAQTGGQYRQATKPCPLFFAFNDQTIEHWYSVKDSGGKWCYPPNLASTYLPNQYVDYGFASIFFGPYDINKKRYTGKEIYDKLLEFSECKDGYATPDNKCPIRLRGDFHEIVSDILIEKYNLNKDELSLLSSENKLYVL